MDIWKLRKVLLSADQLCLSRIQVHVLLSIVKTNEYGFVDINYFLRICCTVIPLMFDAAKFMDKAALVAKEKADAQAREELEELQGLTGGAMSKAKKGDEEEAADDDRTQGMDREAVEKTLINILLTHDEKRSSHHTLELQQFLSVMQRSDQVAACQLSDAETRGFIAEAPLDEQGEIAYVDHVKTWVPILFEVRKSRVQDAFISKDWGSDGVPLVDLSRFEETFPVLHGLPPEEKTEDDQLQSNQQDSVGELADDSKRKSSKLMSVARASSRFLHRSSTSGGDGSDEQAAAANVRGSLRSTRTRGSLQVARSGSKELGEHRGSKERASVSGFPGFSRSGSKDASGLEELRQASKEA